MNEQRMYTERLGNIPVMRYCGFSCTYCAFQKFTKISPCPDCRAGINHAHMEVLLRTPPKTKQGEFITIGLSGDVSFMRRLDFMDVLQYCYKWNDRTFLIQSKNPEYFTDCILQIPDNVILGTTIETNLIGTFDNSKHLTYETISKAPTPFKRYDAMLDISDNKTKTAVTIEPILQFSDKLKYWIKYLNPEFVYIGYDSKPDKNRLPEPTLEKTLELIKQLEESGIEVRKKLIRKAYYE